MNIFDFISVVGLSGGDGGSGGAAGSGDGSGDGGGSGGGGAGSGHEDSRNLPVMPQWAGNLPDEITATESNRNILMQHKDGDAMIEVPTGLVKSYMDSKRVVSGMVNIPGENATAEQTASFNKKMGVPDDAKGYGLKVPDGSPEGMFSDVTMNAFRADAHELGVPKTTAEELFSRFAGRQVEAYNGALSTQNQNDQTQLDALKKELGADFDSTLALANKAVAYANPEMFKIVEQKGLLNNVSVVRGFAKMGKDLGEGVLKGAGEIAPAITGTKEDLEAIMADPKYKLPQGNAIGEAWRAKYRALNEQIYGGTGSVDTGPSSGRALHGA